jgi:hypothetical protein
VPESYGLLAVARSRVNGAAEIVRNHSVRDGHGFSLSHHRRNAALNPLLFPYIFNILVLVPVGLLTLFGGAKGGRLVFQDKFPESEGIRTILGSLWTAILIGSILGLLYPVPMSPLLLIQVIYKLLWLLVFVLPRLRKERSSGIPRGIAWTFLVIVVSYPWVIPWQQLFNR